eukprot:29985_1
MSFVMVQKLTFRYVQELESQYRLSSVIPVGIIQIISQLYPVLIEVYFGIHNKNVLCINNDRLVVTGKDLHTCDAYAVHGASATEIRLASYYMGIHMWSLKKVSEQCCHHVIGVQSKDLDCLQDIRTISGFKYELNESEFQNCYEHCAWGDEEQWVGESEFHEMYPDAIYSWAFFEASYDWKQGEIVTIVLDCEEWKVKWYKYKETDIPNKLSKPIKVMDIKAYHEYCFCFMTCARSDITNFKIVENPVSFY